jgi:hypothetical protein
VTTEPAEKPLVYVKYLDHVLYRNMTPSVEPKPVVRETVGWLMRENEEVVLIVWDRAAAPSKLEKLDPTSSLVILKKCIVEMRRLG